MAEMKYDHLIKRLVFHKTPATTIVSMPGIDLEGLSLSFTHYYTATTGPAVPGMSGQHIHPYNECIILTGTDATHPQELGAEVEVTLGEEGENYRINSPSVVIVPAGAAHSSPITRKASQPYGSLIVSLSREYQAAPVTPKAAGLAGGRQYESLIKNLNFKDMQRKAGGNADYIAAWNGKEFPGFDMNFTWALHKGTGPWHKRDPHVHPYDEILLFMGGDAHNPEYLGAEIEIAMGEEQEKHVINTSTVVIAPKNLVHCPLVTRRVDRPYYFSAICLNTEHVTNWLGQDTGIGL